MMDQIVYNVARYKSRQLLGTDMPNFMFGDSKPNYIRTRASRSRPHSSPERYRAKQPQARIINNSSCQPTRVRVIASFEGAPSDAHIIGEELLSHRPPASAGLAYFADQPPVAPVRIVVVKRTPETDLTIPISKTVTTSTEHLQSRNYPSSFPDATTSTNLLKPSSTHVQSEVRHILQDLMSALPLRLMSSPVSQRRSQSPDYITSDSNLRTESPPAAFRRHKHLSHRSPLRRHISYKTIDQISDAAHTVSEKGEGTHPEDWMGGVRALRDSHVRLVLRQLRHIDRLNRALDRFTKVSGKR